MTTTRATFSLVFLGAILGCGPASRNEPQDAAPVEPDATPCVGLECFIPQCDDGLTTTITGTVYAPNGTLPLPNATVLIPNAELAPFTEGVTCDRCGAPLAGDPVASAQTNFMGQFTLVNVPAGNSIPLVVQLGKWRRTVTIPAVVPCQDNPLTDHDLTRLPRTQSEGHMPRIAVTLGGCDQVSCLLPKLGIAPSEFGAAGEDKAVTFYSTPGTVGPPGTSSATPFWSSVTELSKYDMVILSCECSEHLDTKDATSFQAMADYLNMGGRVFSTDFQYTWYKDSPDPQLASIGNIPGGAPSGASPIMIDSSFPKGKTLADWMDFTMTSTGYGLVTPSYVYGNFASMDPLKTQTFGSSGGAPRFVTINTPVGIPAEEQCGKAVHLDAHIGNSSDHIDENFPAGCTSPFSSGEAAFAYFFFDLANCIQDDSGPIL